MYTNDGGTDRSSKVETAEQLALDQVTLKLAGCKIDTTTLPLRWHQRKSEKGVFLIDTCGNIASLLTAAVGAGYYVAGYIHLDIDPNTKVVATATVARTLATHPKQVSVRCLETVKAEVVNDVTQWTPETAKSVLAMNTT